MKILVTGGAGFIGSNLVDALIEKDHEVSIVDNLSTGNRENINKKAKFFEADVTNEEDLVKIFSEIKPEAVFHLAAQVSVEVSTKDPSRDVKNNVIGTINVLRQVKNLKVKKFIFSSTGGAIYGDDAPRPTTEEAKAEPLTPYGIDKLCAEGFIRFFASDDSFNYSILRFANVYGPRQDPNGEAGVIAIFTKRMLNNEPSKIYGDGKQTRDYVYVQDIVRGLILAMEEGKNGVYNLATGVETTVNEISEKLVELTSTSAIPDHAPGRKEQHASSLSFDKIKREMGWDPQVVLEDGLKKTVDWFANSEKSEKHF